MCRFKNGCNSVAVANPYRLGDNVIPESYALRLSPDLSTGNYSGEVSIRIEVRDPTSEILINAITEDEINGEKRQFLNISEAIVQRGNGTLLNATIVPDPSTERVALQFNGAVGSGEWTLKLRFTGVLANNLKGFYRSTYEDSDGNEQVIATTQFEAAEARRAFPCFDEPEMKATFQITLEIDPDLQAISNSPVKTITSTAAGKKVVEFAPTMRMSTYIVAFVVGKLVSTKPVTVDGTDIRVWCVPGKEHLTRFAHETAQFALRYFRLYFGVPYPGDKLDLLAIPDFDAGAMENLGCVTFRETGLLVDPETASQDTLEYSADVISHELAHMWFGDLVTMKWWNGLWLNEAFATFMSAKCVDAWKKHWGVWESFGLSRGSAFRTDALKSTRPVEYTVVSPNDADGMFDVLTYEKGCSVMRMLEQYMGETKFRTGIARYIELHAYGNTDTDDLWRALEDSSGMPVGTIMHNWIFTPGFPVVSVSRSDKSGAVVLGQQCFKYLSEAVDHSQLWQVPLILKAKTASGIITMKHLLTQAEETVYLGEDLDWVIVNAGGHGFYRVLYSNDLQTRLTTNVQTTLNVIERVNLLSDSWAGVRAGLSSSLDFLNTVKLFGSERDPNVWAMITGPLVRLRRLLPKENRPAFESLVRELVSPALSRVGWTPVAGESSQQRVLRADLIGTLAITGGDTAAQAQAQSMFESWKADHRSVDGNIIDAVIQIVASVGDESLYDEFVQLSQNAQSPEDEERFRSALTSFSDLNLHKRTLASCMNPSKIRTQDAPYLVASVMDSEEAGEYAWQFVQDNWNELTKLYSETGVVGMCGGVTALSGEHHEAQVQAFFAGRQVKAAGQSIEQYLETLRIGALFKQREAAALKNAFPVPAC